LALSTFVVAACSAFSFHKCDTTSNYIGSFIHEPARLPRQERLLIDDNAIWIERSWGRPGGLILELLNFGNSQPPVGLGRHLFQD
jgi:hypothetical protein